MMWPAENRDVCCLETKKLHSDAIHIAKEKVGVGAVGVGKGGSQVECCAISININPSGDYGVIDEIVTNR
jgi:hypothetical protein